MSSAPQQSATRSAGFPVSPRRTLVPLSGKGKRPPTPPGRHKPWYARLLRVPIPVRLLLSYFLVIALGAVPTFVYLWQETFRQLTVNSARDLAASAERLQQMMIALPIDQRLNLAKDFAQLTTIRVTYLTAAGLVLYDSEAVAATMENHLERPEVMQALGMKGQESNGIGLSLPGLGLARRVSATTSQELLYVAIPVPISGVALPSATGGNPAGGAASTTVAAASSAVKANPGLVDVLRLARKVSQIRSVTNDSLDFARNSQAVAVSAALLLSLLSAVIFSRPLQKVVKVARTMESGDLAVTLGPLGDDEVGDVGRALEQLALSLRRRLATSRSGEAMLAQLVEALDTPIVVVELDGELVAINGSGRRLLQLGMKEIGAQTGLAAQPVFQAAAARAEAEGEPEQVLLPLVPQTADPGEGGQDVRMVRCVIHILKRPGMEPLCAIVGEEWGGRHGFLAPDPRAVRPVPLRQLLEAIHERVASLMGLTGTRLVLPTGLQVGAGELSGADVRAQSYAGTDKNGTQPDILIADVDGRLLWGTILLLVECATLEHANTLAPEIDVKPLYVTVELREVRAAGGVLNVLRALWEPLGGEVKQVEQSLVMRWPRA